MKQPKAFDRLHPDIQRVLWDMKWTELRPIQTETIHYICDNTNDLVIAAATAGGKTEAAFLPVLSHIAGNFKESIRVLYVGPLKALINDQFRRLEKLCERAAIPVSKWHGDVSGGKKKRLIGNPAGVLLITPESVESLFVNRSPYLDRMFGSLEFIVIDEIHSFMGTERGIHLQSLLSRMNAFSRKTPRRIGLSATLGDMRAACEWLHSGSDEVAGLIKGEDERTLAVIIKGYLEKSFLKIQKRQDATEQFDNPVRDDVDMAKDIFNAFRGRTNLIFGNAKSRLEYFTDLLRQICTRNRHPNEFLVHHGSLAKAIREEAETMMQSGKPFTTFCTNTLELGIDIGYVDSVGQIDPPCNVSSLIQRVGRSGRQKGAIATLRFFIKESEPDSQSDPWHTLYQNLLQAVAMIELLVEKWCETPDRDRLHYSTLVQQILSVLAQTGGARADKLYEMLVEKGVFQNISKKEFVAILGRLGKKDLIEQMPEGDLILGLTGQRIVNHYDFYAVFQTPEEYRVLTEGITIGTLPMRYPIPVGDHIILAGKRWQVLECNDDRKEIIVIRSKGGRPPIFLPGYGDIAPEIRHKMRHMLFSESIPRYLDSKALEMFGHSRETAKRLNLDKETFHQFGPDAVLFTWTGSKINTTLQFVCQSEKCKVSDIGIGLVFEEKTIGNVRNILKDSVNRGLKNLNIFGEISKKTFEKYDNYLPEQLLDKAYERNRLCLSGAVKLITEINSSYE